jgi:ureidoacrylate peracid hydrolase
MTDQSVVEHLQSRVRDRQACAPPARPLVGERTALVVVDLQNFFVAPGMPMTVPAAESLIPRVNRLATGVRSAGGVVAWVQMTADPDGPPWRNFYATRPPSLEATLTEMLRPGRPAHALHADLRTEPADLFVQKRRFSAFLQGSSDLDRVLRARGVDTIVVVGTLSNVCCESTSRDAMMLDYRVLLVSDANAALDDVLASMTLLNIVTAFGEVPSTEEVLALLAG